MSFCLRPNVCKKCGKPLTMFEGWICIECEKAEQEPILDKISDEVNKLKKVSDGNKVYVGINDVFEIIDKYKVENEDKE